MIDREALINVIEKGLKDSDTFLVEVTISPENTIAIEIDSKSGVNIDECVQLTRLIEASFDRDKEDYELEVGSAGLTSPFKVKAQYDKNIGNEVEVLTLNGKKIKGILKKAAGNDFTVVTTKKVKKEGEKRPALVEEDETFLYDEIKYTKYLIQFK